MSRIISLLSRLESDICLYSAGGVVLVNASKRIKVDNTLDERLRLLEDRVSCTSPFLRDLSLTSRQMLPEIRRDLFGINENRKFYT